MTTRRRVSSATRSSRFGVYLEPGVHTALLKAAIDAGMSATELVERLIFDYLKSVAPKPSRRSAAKPER